MLSQIRFRGALAVVVGLTALWSYLVFAQGADHSKADAGPNCLILGDSIAVGTAQQARCMVAALNEISTKQWVRQFSATVEPIASAFEVVLISLGSNGGKLPDAMTYQYLTRSRKSVPHAKRVVWIAPGHQFPVRAQVQAVAMMHGDVVYERPVEQLHADSVHFTKAAYQRIASALRNCNEFIAPM